MKKSNQITMAPIASLLLSSKAMSAKFLMFSSSYFLWQAATVTGEWWKILNVSVALFVMGIGIYILWKQLKKESEEKDRLYDKFIDMTEIQSRQTEKVTQALENSTDSNRQIARTLERFINRFERYTEKQ